MVTIRTTCFSIKGTRSLLTRCDWCNCPEYMIIFVTALTSWSLYWRTNAFTMRWKPNIQCVHKVPSGFWKIVALKQIELATCGLRQITVKLEVFYWPQYTSTWAPLVARRTSRRYSRKMDRQRRSNALASTFTRHNTTEFFPVGLCQEQCVPNTS